MSGGHWGARGGRVMPGPLGKRAEDGGGGAGEKGKRPHRLGWVPGGVRDFWWARGWEEATMG